MNLSNSSPLKRLWQQLVASLVGGDAGDTGDTVMSSNDRTLEEWGVRLEPGNSRLGRDGYHGPSWVLVVVAGLLVLLVAALAAGVLFAIVWLLSHGVVDPEGIATMTQGFYPRR